MTYGLSITNPSGELVISSEGFGLYCVGKCALQGSVVQPTGIFPSSSPGQLGGYSRYRITSVNTPIFAIDLPLNKRVGLRGMTNVGGNVWEVEVHCGDTPDPNAFDAVEYQVDVWAFAQHSGTPAGPYGMAIYNAAGALAYDFTAGVPLAAVAYVDGIGSPTIPSLTRPVILGWTPTDETQENFQGGNTWHVRRRRGAWMRTSSTALAKVDYTEQKYRYFSPAGSPVGVAGGDVYNQPGFILEGSVLP